MTITTDLFTIANLSEAINTGDRVYGQIGRAGIFPDAPEQIFSRVAVIDEQGGQLEVATDMPLGSTGDTLSIETDKTRTVAIPHFPAQATLTGESIRAARATGMDELATMAYLVNRELDRHRKRFELTKEVLKARAIQGAVTDGSGKTLFNAYTEFGISQVTKSIPASGLHTYSTDLSREVEDGLNADLMDGAIAFCSPSLFDAILALAIEDADKVMFPNQQFGTDIRKDGFVVSGVRYVEYNAKARNAAGTRSPIIADGTGYAVPGGNTDAFKYFVAPADFNETINTSAAMEYYASLESLPHNRGYSIHSQANILPICMRPGACVKLSL